MLYLHEALIAWRNKTLGDGPVIVRTRWQMTALSIVIWFARAYKALGLMGAPRTRGAERSSLGQPGLCTRRVDRCATFSCLQADRRSKPPNDISTAIATRNGDLSPDLIPIDSAELLRDTVSAKINVRGCRKVASNDRTSVRPGWLADIP